MNPEPVRNRLVAWRTAPAILDPTIGIYFARFDYEARRIDVAISLTMQSQPEGGDTLPQDPLLKLSTAEAQVLMDSLWDVGVRPTEGSGSAGAMLATQEHLKDARLEVSWLRDINRRLIDSITDNKEITE